jgi:hypothetical protein
MPAVHKGVISVNSSSVRDDDYPSIHIQYIGLALPCYMRGFYIVEGVCDS